MLYTFWDQRSVIWYELLKPGKTTDGLPYQRQLVDLEDAMAQNRPEYQRWQN